MSVKIDHRISDKSALFVEYLYNPSYYANYRLAWKGATAPTQGASGAEPYTTANQIFTIGHTQTFNPTLINEFRASYSRQNQIRNRIRVRWSTIRRFSKGQKTLTLFWTSSSRCPQ